MNILSKLNKKIFVLKYKIFFNYLNSVIKIWNIVKNAKIIHIARNVEKIISYKFKKFNLVVINHAKDIVTKLENLKNVQINVEQIKLEILSILIIMEQLVLKIVRMVNFFNKE